MRHLLRRCLTCNIYTMKDRCPRCNSSTHNPHPPRFSLDDRYIRYRISERYKKDQGETDEQMSNE